MAECAEASDSEARKNNEKQKNEKRYSETEGETHTGQSARIFSVFRISEAKPAPTRTLFVAISELLVPSPGFRV